MNCVFKVRVISPLFVGWLTADRNLTNTEIYEKNDFDTNFITKRLKQFEGILCKLVTFPLKLQ